MTRAPVWRRLVFEALAVVVAIIGVVAGTLRLTTYLIPNRISVMSSVAGPS
jgi:hypothetical protein